MHAYVVYIDHTWGHVQKMNIYNKIPAHRNTDDTGTGTQIQVWAGSMY